MTLSPAIVHEAKRLLAQGCGHRQIERLMAGAISKAKISQLAREISAIGHTTATHDAAPLAPPTFGKCPGCHYTVELPCRICRARDYRHRHQQYKRERKRRRKENRS